MSQRKAEDMVYKCVSALTFWLHSVLQSIHPFSRFNQSDRLVRVAEQCRSTRTTVVDHDSILMGALTLQISRTTCPLSKKWKHQFAEAQLIIYVINKRSFGEWHEDGRNEIFRSRECFDQLINDPLFRMCPVVLLYLRSDDFEKEMTTSHMTRIFPTYTGNDNLNEFLEFTISQFKSVDQTPNRDFYTIVDADGRMIWKNLRQVIADTNISVHLRDGGPL